MGLFDTLNKSGSEKTAGELATITGGDKLLIGEQFYPCHARFQRLTLSSPYSEAIGCQAHSNRDGFRGLHSGARF